MKKRAATIAGFTLIELLIVVAIIGILGAISIPLFRDYTSRSNNSAAVADLRNFKTAMEAELTANHRYPIY